MLNDLSEAGIIDKGNWVSVLRKFSADSRVLKVICIERGGALEPFGSWWRMKWKDSMSGP